MAQQSSREFASTDPTKGEEDARVQERGNRQRFLSVHAATQNTFNVQRHLTSARTRRAFRASALQTWHEVEAMSDEFKVEIVGMADRNQALMDRTPGQVKQIIDGAELVFAGCSS